MTTFWGCDPHTLEELAASWDRGAAELRAMAQRLLAAGGTTTWSGADADAHAAARCAALAHLVELARRVAERAAEIRENAAEQEAASAAEDAAEIPGAGRPRVIAPAPARPAALPERPGGHQPALMMDYDAIPRLRRLLAEPGGVRETPPADPLDLDERYLEGARGVRAFGVAAVPGGSLVQSGMELHHRAGETIDTIESELPWASPILAPARVSHAVAGVALGERSVAAQALGSIDRGLASAAQAADETVSALHQGDLAGAARAVERGALRGMDASADLVLAHPGGAWAHAGAEVSHAMGDAAEPFAPGLAAGLHRAGDAIEREWSEKESALSGLSDPQLWYDQRRTHAPMPWDVRS